MKFLIYITIITTCVLFTSCKKDECGPNGCPIDEYSSTQSSSISEHETSISVEPFVSIKIKSGPQQCDPECPNGCTP